MLYIEHFCYPLLLSLCSDLDFGRLAHGFALLNLPRMPELKKKDVSYFVPVEMDYDSIAFKDKVREKARQERLGQEKKVKLTRPPRVSRGIF